MCILSIRVCCIDIDFQCNKPTSIRSHSLLKCRGVSKYCTSHRAKNFDAILVCLSLLLSSNYLQDAVALNMMIIVAHIHEALQSQVALRLHRLGTLKLARGESKEAVQLLTTSSRSLTTLAGEVNPLTGESR